MNLRFAAIFVLFANAFSAGMMFFASVFISRYGGKELLGFFSVLVGLIITATPLATLGMDTAIVRFVPKYRQQGYQAFASGMQMNVLAMSGIISLIAGAGMTNALIAFRSYSFEVALIAGGCLPLAVIMTVLQAVLRADANVSRAVASEAVVRPLVFVFVLACVYFSGSIGLSLVQVIGAYAVALIFGTGTAMAMVLSGGHISWFSELEIRLTEFRQWLQLGLTALFSQLSIALLNQSPIILAGLLLSAFDAGELGAVIRLSMLVAFALTAVNSVVSPFIAIAMEKNDKWELQSIVARASWFSFSVAVPVCITLFIFASQILSVFGDDFEGAVQLLRIMVVAYAIQAACGPTISLLNMTGQHILMTKVLFVWAVFAFFVGWIAMACNGIFGGVLVSAISIAGYPLSLGFLCRKTIGVDPTLLSLKFFLQR